MLLPVCSGGWLPAAPGRWLHLLLQWVLQPLLQRDWGWGLPADQAGFLERAGSEVDRSRRSGVVCNTLRSTGVGLTLSEGGLLCAAVGYIVLVGPAGAIWGGRGLGPVKVWFDGLNLTPTNVGNLIPTLATSSH